MVPDVGRLREDLRDHVTDHWGDADRVLVVDEKGEAMTVKTVTSMNGICVAGSCGTSDGNATPAALRLMAQHGRRFVDMARDGHDDRDPSLLMGMRQVLAGYKVPPGVRLLALKAMVRAITNAARIDRPTQREPGMVINTVASETDRHNLDGVARELMAAATRREWQRFAAELRGLLDYLDRTDVLNPD